MNSTPLPGATDPEESAELGAGQFEPDLLTDLTALLEAEHGPVSDEARSEARRSWPDAR